jgi:hypothetical protein
LAPSARARLRRAAGRGGDNESVELYCHECGTRAQTGDRFCRVCGSKLRVE